MRVSVVIPCFNEEAIIEASIKRLLHFLCQHFVGDFEIIVVDDGSTDQTLKILKGIIAQNIHIISYAQNKGKGFAVQQGMAKAQGEFVFFMDSDLSTELSVLPLAVDILWKSEGGVFGNRKHRKSQVEVSFFRELIGTLLNAILRGLFAFSTKDTQCGFKGFTSQASRQIFPYIQTNAWAFDVEIFLLARKRNINMQEIPVNWKNGKKSCMNFVGGLRFLYHILVLYRRWKNH